MKYAMEKHSKRDIETAILDLVTERGAAKSICPSEAARALAGTDEKAWRLLMKPIRASAVSMANAGAISILRKGKPVDPNDFRGVYRLSLPRTGDGKI